MCSRRSGRRQGIRRVTIGGGGGCRDHHQLTVCASVGHSRLRQVRREHHFLRLCFLAFDLEIQHRPISGVLSAAPRTLASGILEGGIVEASLWDLGGSGIVVASFGDHGGGSYRGGEFRGS